MYISSTTKKMIFKELRDFPSRNYHQRTKFAKEDSYYLVNIRKKRFTVTCN